MVKLRTRGRKWGSEQEIEKNQQKVVLQVPERGRKK